MNVILNGLLDNNLVHTQYISAGRFPTQALLTRNPNFAGANVSFPAGNFLSAYDVIRKKRLTILNEDEILATSVYNPANISPENLYNGTVQPTKSVATQAKAEFHKKCGDLVSRGDPYVLSKKDKCTIIAFYTGFNCEDLSEEEVDTNFQDLAFAPPEMLMVTPVRLGFFFAYDYEFESEEAGVLFGAQQWIRLLKVYQNLSLQGIDESDFLFKAIKNINFPDPESFRSIDQIVAYWPAAMNPRPSEIGSLKIEV